MNVPRDYQSLFDNVVNNINTLIQWAPDGNSTMQLSYALSGLKVGFQRAKEAFANLKVEPPQGANDLNSQKVSETLPPKLDFAGRWRTRGGSEVSVEEWNGKEWMGHSEQNWEIWWDENGKALDDNGEEWDLVDRFREGAGFANA